MQESQPRTASAIKRLVNSCVISPSACGARMNAPSRFQDVKVAPPDPILGVTIAYNADSDPDKLDLGVGAYRTEEKAPLVLPVVRKVERALAQNDKLNKEYLPIDGLADFRNASIKLLLGADSPAIAEKRVAVTQALSGTGGLRLGAAFMERFFPPGTPVYISSPTWGNHTNIFQDAGVKDVRSYRYYKAETRGLDYEGFLADLRAAPKGSMILLHTCAHNPTGVDPTIEQWNGILDVIQEKELFPFFDTAYQGFATGDLDRDAAPVRIAVSRGFELMASQSYSKNFGLYGERVGCFSMVCKTPEIANAVVSQLKIIVRPMYSNPPTWGARIVATVLNDKELFAEWVDQLRGMSSRIQRMRQELYDAIKKNGTPGTWEHILEQIGMFSFTGLTKPQVELLINKHHIYMLTNGRISMAGLTSATVPKLANAIHEAVTTVK